MSRIVIIEDNPNNARLAEKLLKHAGHEVRVADNGEDGLMQVFTDAPDVVLVDMGLPDIDGQTIVGMLRRRAALKQVRVVAFTAWPEDRVDEMAKAYGCDGVITKPIDTRRFAEQVQAFVSAPKAEPAAADTAPPAEAAPPSSPPPPAEAEPPSPPAAPSTEPDSNPSAGQ
ncbi:MAG: response regulator [Anaerolineae bacterium]|nr:response regulator [Anaerolineae bacterium]